MPQANLQFTTYPREGTCGRCTSLAVRLEKEGLARLNELWTDNKVHGLERLVTRRTESSRLRR
jgi:hypothetical protein